MAQQPCCSTITRVHQTQTADNLSSLSSLTLSKPLKKPFRELMRLFQNADHDKTFEVQEKVEELQTNMQENVRKILETHSNLESLEHRTENMSRQADQFLKQSVDLRRAIQWRNFKLKIATGLVCGSVLTYFFIGIL